MNSLLLFIICASLATTVVGQTELLVPDVPVSGNLTQDTPELTFTWMYLAGKENALLVKTDMNNSVVIRASSRTIPSAAFYEWGSGGNYLAIPVCASGGPIPYYATVSLKGRSLMMDFDITLVTSDVEVVTNYSLIGSLPAISPSRVFQTTVTDAYSVPIVKITSLDNTTNAEFDAAAFMDCTNLNDTIESQTDPTDPYSRFVQLPLRVGNMFINLTSDRAMMYNVTMYYVTSMETQLILDYVPRTVGTAIPNELMYFYFDITEATMDKAFVMTVSSAVDIYLSKSQKPTVTENDQQYMKAFRAYVSPCKLEAGRYYVGIMSTSAVKLTITAGLVQVQPLNGYNTTTMLQAIAGWPLFVLINFGTLKTSFVTTKIDGPNGIADISMGELCEPTYHEVVAITVPDDSTWKVASPVMNGIDYKMFLSIVPDQPISYVASVTVAPTSPPNWTDPATSTTEMDLVHSSSGSTTEFQQLASRTLFTIITLALVALG